MYKIIFSMSIHPKLAIAPFNYHNPIAIACPYCGSKNFHLESSNYIWDEVKCCNCAAVSPYFKLFRTAVSKVKP